MKFEDVVVGTKAILKRFASLGDVLIEVKNKDDKSLLIKYETCFSNETGICVASDIEPFINAQFGVEDIMKQKEKQKEFEVGDIVECSYLSSSTLYCVAHVGKESAVVIGIDGNSVRYTIQTGKLKHTVKQPEFVWDNVVHTIDKPFQHTDGNWYIKVDGSVGAIYDKPKQFCYFKTYDNSVQSCEVYAIVPTTPYKYISLDNRWCQDMFLPVTYNPKVIEVTMDDLEKKYGCRVKIVK